MREDNAPIYGVMLPVKSFPLKSKISKLLKFAISTKRIDDSNVRRKYLKWLPLRRLIEGKSIKIDVGMFTLEW